MEKKKKEGKVVLYLAIATVVVAVLVFVLALCGVGRKSTTEDISAFKYYGQGFVFFNYLRGLVTMDGNSVCSIIVGLINYALIVLAIVSLVLAIVKKKPLFACGTVVSVLSTFATTFAVTLAYAISSGSSHAAGKLVFNKWSYIYVFLAALILVLCVAIVVSEAETLVRQKVVAKALAESGKEEPKAEETEEEPVEVEESKETEPEEAAHEETASEEPATEEPVEETEEETEEVTEEAEEETTEEETVEEESTEETSEEPVEEEAEETVEEEAAEAEPEEAAQEETASEEPAVEQPVEEKKEEPVREKESEAIVLNDLSDEDIEDEDFEDEDEDETSANSTGHDERAKLERVKNSKTPGKYEVYPEVGAYKYRLKANNGQIILISAGYVTRDGAKAAIETLKKNIKGGVARIITDKNGLSQFRVYIANGTRVIALGESYASEERAKSALISLQRFYSKAEVVDLDEIPDSERREWKIEEFPEASPREDGKLELFLDSENRVRGRLIAVNGEVLFTTNSYKNIPSFFDGYEGIKRACKEQRFSLHKIKQKQERYQYKLVAKNRVVLIVSEIYASKDGAQKAALTMRNYLENPKVVNLTGLDMEAR